MYNRSLLLVGLAVVSAAAIGMAQERMPRFDGPIDVQSLRSRTLGDIVPREMLEAPMPAEPFTTVEPPRGSAASWGITLGQIPDLLYLHCPALKDGRGLLIADVLPDSPAEQAGLCPGQILLKIDDEALYRPADLPELRRALEVLLLDQGEVVKTTLSPCPPEDLVPAPPIRGDAVYPESYRLPSRRSAVSDSADMQQAIAVACANGQYKIEAMMPVGRGYKKVRLEGTRRQVEKQLADLPPSLRSAIRRQLPEMDASY